MGLFAMPSLGSDMEAGTLVEWLVKPGDHVKRGDVIAVVETQKGAIEIEVFEEGEVARLDAKLGEKLPVGAPMALIVGEGEAAPEAAAAPVPEPAAVVEAPAPEVAPPPEASAAPETGAPPAPRAEVPPRPAAPVPPPAGAEGAPPDASPAARALAAERGVDLSGLVGSGPGGAILLRDVEGAAQGAAPARPDPMAEMRKAIAAAMSRSKREIPHYYLAHEVDLAAATAWLEETNAARPPETRLLMGALFLRAVALSAAEAPMLNGQYEDGRYTRSASVHAGMAVAMRGGGLIAPAIRDAERRSLDEIMAAMRDVVARVRAGRLRSSELTDGTITVSSLGEHGVDEMTGVIYPPQVALVCFGAPGIHPRIVRGQVVARPAVAMTLAADHRVSDGRTGAKFLAAVAARLQVPEEL